MNQRLALPHLAADLDRLPHPAERCLVRHTVEPLDHLCARGADAELEATVRERVESGGGHGQHGRRARVERQDRRHEGHPLGDRREVAEAAHRIERIRLGDRDHVGADPFELDDLGGCRGEVGRVVDEGAESHGPRLGESRGLEAATENGNRPGEYRGDAVNSGPRGIRTPDLFIANEARYQLRHGPWKLPSHDITL